MVDASRLRPRHARMPSTFDAFRHPGFRLLWPANFFSFICRWMQMTLSILFVLELTDSPFLVTLVGFSSMIPLLLFGAFGGVLADRADRRKVLLASQVANMLAAAAMCVLLLLGMAQFWHAYIVVFVGGLGWAFDMPSRRSIVMDIIGRAGVTNGMALDSVGMHGSRMAGPALAGVLIAAFEPVGGYFTVLAFYLVSIAFLLILKSPPRSAPVARTSGVLKNLLEGVSYAASNRVILATVIITVFMNLLLFPYMQMAPVIAKHTLGLDERLIGLLMGAEGLGAIVGAIAIASAGRLRYHGRVYVIGSAVGLCMALAFSASQWFAVSLPLLILLGLGTSGFGTMQSTIVVIASSEEMRGRALGVISLAIGAGPIGALIIGAVAELTSPATAIMIFASCGLVSLAAVSALMPAIFGRMGQPPPGDRPSPPIARPDSARPR